MTFWNNLKSVAKEVLNDIDTTLNSQEFKDATILRRFKEGIVDEQMVINHFRKVTQDNTSTNSNSNKSNEILNSAWQAELKPQLDTMKTWAATPNSSYYKEAAEKVAKINERYASLMK